jgi:hypothetical protein
VGDDEMDRRSSRGSPPGGPNDPPPPAREQLPLPRRRQQDSLAPQLRVPGGADDGTPFAAFTATEPGPVPAADRDLPAEFQEGARRARRDTRRRRGQSTD